MGSSSDEDDGDYVPEVDEEEDDDVLDADDATVDTQRSVTDSHLDTLWDDMNAATAVSKKAADKTAKLLSGLTKKTKRSADKKKKRKLHEFSCPILSVDVKKSRKNMADVAAASKQKVDRVVKFAGKEYNVSTSAATKQVKGGKKGLDKVLESLDEPKKVSTMEKTSLDWDKFKEKEGIEEELTQYTKDGYIEKQEFLQRLDHKRFEIEKAERDKQRKLQQQPK